MRPTVSKYYFDWMVAKPHNGATLQPLRARKQCTAESNVCSCTHRRLWIASATGCYEWSGDRLLRMVANDGREISLGYNAKGLIASATAAGRTWTYGYTEADILRTSDAAGRYPMGLQPAAAAVTHKYADYIGQSIWEYMDYPATCSRVNKIVPSEITLSIQHPSGALGILFRLFHGRKNVKLDCQTSGDNHLFADGWNYTPVYRDAGDQDHQRSACPLHSGLINTPISTVLPRTWAVQ